MQQKKDKKPDKNAQKDRNTSYYRARVKASAKKKKDSSLYAEKAKKRQMNSYIRAVTVLFVLMAVFTGVIFLGMHLNGLVEPDESAETTENSPDIWRPVPSSEVSAADPPESTGPEQGSPGEISEIFYSYNGVYLDVSNLESLESLQYFVDNIKSKGINAVNIDIKKEDGTVPYHINGQTDSVMLGSNQIGIPIKSVIELLHDNGLYVSGTICCFKDSLAGSTFVNYALKSSSDLMKWEDSGGSLWLSAYSEGARNYIKSIVEDSAKLGFDEIILSWFFFPNVANEQSIVYGNQEDARDKYAVVKDFVTEQRRALDQIAPRIKLGFYVPLPYFLNAPGETTGLSPADLAEWCNFFATSFAPADVPAGTVLGGDAPSNYEAHPFETVKALCGRFEYISDIANFRPYLQAFGGYGEQQVTNQKQALFDSGINVWQLINFENYY